MVWKINSDDLSELIGLVYASALEQRQWQRLDARIIEMFPGHIAMTVTFQNDRMVGVYYRAGRIAVQAQKVLNRQTADGKRLQMIDGELAEWADLHRRVDMTLGAVGTSRRIWREDEFRGNPSYAALLGPAGLGHWTAVVFARNGSRHALNVFLENERDHAAKDTQGLMRVLKILSPHFVRAARMARALYMAQEAAETYKGFMDAIGLPLIIVDAQGVLQTSNAAGQRMLDRAQVLSVGRSGRVALQDRYEDEAFQKCLRAARAQDTPQGLRIDRDDGNLSLCIASFYPSIKPEVLSELDVFDSHRLYAVFLGANDAQAVNAGLLQDVFDLTEREAQVCSALAAGQSPAQIACASGRAEKTIRNQIQAVHEKVGVHSERSLSEALSVFRAVGAMADHGDASF